MKKLLLVLVVISFCSLFVGVGNLSLAALFQGDESAWQLLLTSRVPRLLAILLSGAGLSIAGLIMQQVSQNLWLIFGVSMLGTLVFVFFIQRIQFKNVIFVPLIGIIFGNVIDSLATFIAYKYDAIQNLSGWAVANFANLLKGDFELLYIAIPVAIFSYLYAARISAVGMGKDFATNLGLNYQQVMIIGVALVSIMSATVVMIVGQLPFLGLIVPNLVSLYYGDNLRKNIPRTAIFGAMFVLLCDLVGRVIIFPYEVPISMIISILGGSVFIALILRGQRHAG